MMRLNEKSGKIVCLSELNKALVNLPFRYEQVQTIYNHY